MQGLKFSLANHDGNVNFIGGQEGSSLVAGIDTELLDVSRAASKANRISASNIFTNGSANESGCVSHSLSIAGFNTGASVSDTLEFDSELAVWSGAGSADIYGEAGQMAPINGLVQFTGSAPTRKSVAIVAMALKLTVTNGTPPLSMHSNTTALPMWWPPIRISMLQSSS